MRSSSFGRRGRNGRMEWRMTLDGRRRRGDRDDSGGEDDSESDEAVAEAATAVMVEDVSHDADLSG